MFFWYLSTVIQITIFFKCAAELWEFIFSELKARCDVQRSTRLNTEAATTVRSINSTTAEPSATTVETPTIVAQTSEISTIATTEETSS